MTEDFSLKKWYLDAADYQGNLYIGYLVSLQWRELDLHGYQHLWRPSNNGIHTRSGLTRQPLPLWGTRQRLMWHTHHLRATWDTLADGLEETLLTTDEGEIRWRCMQPEAKATIHLPELSFTGLGYTECIEMTLPMWKLPFTRLFWGRCHSEHHYLVWIKWDGPAAQHLLWHNGERQTDWMMTDHHMRGSDWQLTVQETLPLREGKLLSTVFQPYSQITRLFPEATFLADERKWYSLGQLESHTGSEPAILIHEEVLW